MKILRLSFFNLRKNKREAAAILFLTLISSFLLGTFISSVANIPKVFDKCFEETGCADSALRSMRTNTAMTFTAYWPMTSGSGISGAEVCSTPQACR